VLFSHVPLEYPCSFPFFLCRFFKLRLFPPPAFDTRPIFRAGRFIFAFFFLLDRGLVALRTADPREFPNAFKPLFVYTLTTTFLLPFCSSRCCTLTSFCNYASSPPLFSYSPHVAAHSCTAVSRASFSFFFPDIPSWHLFWLFQFHLAKEWPLSRRSGNCAGTGLPLPFLGQQLLVPFLFLVPGRVNKFRLRIRGACFAATDLGYFSLPRFSISFLST